MKIKRQDGKKVRAVFTVRTGEGEWNESTGDWTDVSWTTSRIVHCTDDGRSCVPYGGKMYLLEGDRAVKTFIRLDRPVGTAPNRPQAKTKVETRVTPQQLDTPIAELERWGLSMIIINTLERQFDAIYVRHLIGLGEEELMQSPQMGMIRVGRLRKVLRMFFNSESDL